MRVLVPVLTILIAGSAAAVFAAAPAAPQRKPGWWEITTTMAAAPMAMKMNLCTDAATEARHSAFEGQQPPGTDCTPSAISRTPTGWSFSSTCKSDGMTMTTKGVVTGDLQSNYKVEATTTMSPAPTPQMAQHKMTIAARWLGACPAGRKPGDMVMGNGMVMNLNNMAAGPARAR